MLASVSECTHRFSPWVPCQIDLPKSSQQIGSPLVQRLQPRVLDAPLPPRPADDELAVPADGDRERVGARTDALQQVFQGGDDGAKLSLVVRHVVTELDLPRGDGPIRPGDLVTAVPLTRIAKRPTVEDDRVIGPATAATGCKRTARAVGLDANPPLLVGQRALQIAHEVNQLLMGEPFWIDAEQPIALLIVPILLGHA